MDREQHTLAERFDAWARTHPRLLLATVIAAAMLATVLSLSTAEAPVVLYQDF